MVRAASVLSWAPEEECCLKERRYKGSRGMGLPTSESPSNVCLPSTVNRHCRLQAGIVLYSSFDLQHLANTQNQHPQKIWQKRKEKKRKPIRHFRYLKKAVLFPRELNIFLPLVVPPVVQFQVPTTVLVILLIVKVPVTGDLKQICSIFKEHWSLGARRPGFIETPFHHSLSFTSLSLSCLFCGMRILVLLSQDFSGN